MFRQSYAASLGYMNPVSARSNRREQKRERERGVLSSYDANTDTTRPENGLKSIFRRTDLPKTDHVRMEHLPYGIKNGDPLSDPSFSPATYQIGTLVVWALSAKPDSIETTNKFVYKEYLEDLCMKA